MAQAERASKMHKLKNIFRKIFVAVFALGILVSPLVAVADESSSMGDIGEYGSWATEANRQKFISVVGDDLDAYENSFKKTYVTTHVPIEAKAGMALMNGLSHVAHILDASLVRFVKIFLIVAFAFWASFNIYAAMKKPKDNMIDFYKDIIIKGIILGLWLLLLDGGLRTFFGWIMGPIVAIGAYVSNIILDGVAAVGGMNFSDSCAAIQQYATENASEYLVTDAKFAGEILCTPTRLSEFYYAVILYGFSLLKTGLGASALTFFGGLSLIGTFTYVGFKFLFVAFGVIVDLFLVVILLPFTAIAENLQTTEYDGIAGKIYNQFLGLFKNLKLDAQITKYIKAAIYFIALSVVVAIGGAFLAYAVSYDPKTHLLYTNSNSPIELILVGIFIAFIASQSNDIAAKIGAKLDDLDDKNSFRSRFQKDVDNFITKTKTKTSTLYKAWKSRKKKS